MEQRRTLVITGIVLVLIVAVVIGIIYYLIRFIQGRQATTPSPALLPGATQPAIIISPSPFSGSTPATGAAQPANTKVYNGPGFQLNYPSGWGLLTCRNSQNFEFEPANNANQLGVGCDRAVKPVTVLVTNNLSCQGESVRLGTRDVVRKADGTKGGAIDYRWCVITPGVDLDITHRVDPSKTGAYSSQDYSEQIEQMISSIRFSQGS